MKEPIPDLLPDNLVGANEEPAPVAILLAQASRLGAKTKKVVLAEVVSLGYVPRDDDIEEGAAAARYGEREYGFHLVVPSLENYTFQAFRVSYSVAKIYPVRIEGAVLTKDRVAKSKNSFMELLREIFSSAEFLRIINSLVREALAMTA